MKSKQPQELKSKKLSEICKIILSGTPKTSISEYWDGNIKWITPSDMTKINGRYIYDTERKITTEGIKNSSAKLLKKDTIIISARGTVGELCILPSEMSCNQSCYALEVFSKFVRPLYLFYILKNLKNTYAQISHGTVFNTITKTTFDEIKINLPTIDEQDKIIPKLDTLDTKIENLQNQNKILEQTIQVIFKSWFVDFNGQTEFIDSELGQIPKGWSVKRFSDMSNVLSGGTPSTKNPDFWNGDVGWISIDDLKQGIFVLDTEKKITSLGLEKSSAKMLPNGSIVISARGTVGVCSIISKSMTINQSCYALTGKGIINEVFLFFLLKF